MNILLVFSVFYITPVISKSSCNNTLKNSTTENELLDTIRKLAEEAGHPNAATIQMNKKKSSICYKRSCLEAAIQILEAINFTADPCDKIGFGEYACHRRIHRDTDSFHKSEYGNISLVRWMTSEKNDQLTREILLSPIDSGSSQDNPTLNNAKIWYRQCNNETIKAYGTKSLLDLSNKFGGWPILTSTDPNHFNWVTFAAYLAKFKARTLLFDVSPVVTEEGIELKLDKGLIASETYSEEELRNNLVSVLEKVQKGWDDVDADFELPESFDLGIKSTIEAFKQLKQYSSHFYSRKTKIMTISELNNSTENNEINWLAFFEEAFSGTNIDIYENTKVHVNEKYIEILVKLWSSAGTWEASLLQYELFSQFIKYTTMDGIELNENENKCLEQAKFNFGASLSKEFLRRHPYCPEVKKETRTMTDNVRNSLKQIIESRYLNFLNPSSKLLKKFEKLNQFLGYPDWLDNSDNFTHYHSKFEKFEPDNTEYFNNLLKLDAWKEGVDREGFEPSGNNLHYWELNRYIVDSGGAAYRSMSNAMLIPAPTSAEPIYRFRAPGYINYGGIGAILGHELGHAVDKQGIYFDRDGNYRQEGILDQEGMKKYNDWIDNIKQDYSRSRIHYHGQNNDNETIRLKHQLNYTINEDIADLLGVEIAFNAYKNYLNERPHKRDDKLPGLDHISDERLFFVTYSNMWCSEMTETEYKMWPNNDGKYSPDYNRATNPLKRSKRFTDTFNCPTKREDYKI